MVFWVCKRRYNEYTFWTCLVVYYGCVDHVVGKLCTGVINTTWTIKRFRSSWDIDEIWADRREKRNFQTRIFFQVATFHQTDSTTLNRIKKKVYFQIGMIFSLLCCLSRLPPLIARFMGLTWGPSPRLLRPTIFFKIALGDILETPARFLHRGYPVMFQTGTHCVKVIMRSNFVIVLCSAMFHITCNSLYIIMSHKVKREHLVLATHACPHVAHLPVWEWTIGHYFAINLFFGGSGETKQIGSNPGNNRKFQLKNKKSSSVHRLYTALYIM